MSESAFTVTRRDDGVAVLTIDVPGAELNTLRAGFAEELERLLDPLERDAELGAIVIISGKKSGFVAGADIAELRRLKGAAEASELSRTGQRALDRLERFSRPVIAAIHGACLGGGLELSLACHARVASSDESTRLGLPEVKLGLIPALGGTQRLPRLVGLEAALDLMLTGRHLDARRANKLGLVDEVVPEPVLLAAAIKLARALSSGKKRDGGGVKRAAMSLLFSKNPLGRKLFFRTAKQRTLAETRGNYPAPERLLEVVRVGQSHGFEAGLGAEALAFGELAVSAEARQLIGLFFAQNELKKDSGVSDPGAEPKKLRRVAVLGAGLMGTGIAFVTAVNAKLPVRIKDKDERALGRGMAQLAKLFDARAKSRRLPAFERDREFLRVTPATRHEDIGGADIVIEAVFEDLPLKQELVREVEAHAGKGLIFASNTSSLPIAKLAEASRAPERVIGMHYFSPVNKMPLLEVVVTDKTAPAVTASAVELGKRQGKTVIVVRDGPGFYTTRILGPYLNEASHLLAEGVPVETVDRALVSWGFPLGPLALLDEIGIDVGHKVVSVLSAAFGDRMAPPPGIERLLEDQRLGKKNARGFYRYGEGRRNGFGRSKKKERVVDASVYGVLGVEPKAEPPPGEIAQRCALMMVNEAVHCLAEGVLRNARDGDVGAVFGLGFPPFRGGPFRYADVTSARELVRRLSEYEKAHGARFRPAPLLLEMAKDGRTFYT